MPVHVNRPSASISATTTSARTPYPLTPSVSSEGGVMILNLGTGVLFVASGDVTVAATTSGQFIGPNATMILERKSTDTHLAAITATGTATVYFSTCMAM